MTFNEYAAYSQALWRQAMGMLENKAQYTLLEFLNMSLRLEEHTSSFDTGVSYWDMLKRDVSEHTLKLAEGDKP